MLLCGRAQAQARVHDGLPRLMLAPAEYTDVLDAFEQGALPDVSVGLSFLRSYSRASIGREQVGPDDTVSGRYVKVANSSQITNALSLDLAAGIFRDLMLYARLPLVLSDTRELEASSGKTRVPASASSGGDGSGELFALNYKSATRSGVPGVDVGIAWGVVNQFRTPHLPTWVVSLETRIGLGKLMRPCAESTQCSTGINRGTTALSIASRWSYRTRWVEPYLGLRYMHEWATSAGQSFTPHDHVRGYADTSLPSMQELTLGAALVAWEDRARYQRFSIDVRGLAAYISPGRDYSALFDALGTSTDPQLATPYESPAGPVPFTGITNVARHARLSAELALATRAARYIRFRLGVVLSHVTSHRLTDAAPCAADADSGCAQEPANLLYRPVIDLPGQRFLQTGYLAYDLFARASGEF